MLSNNTYRVGIIGAGPAGIACAIQLKRYNLEPILFEKNKIGGLLINANLVENYPGFYTGITGPNLVNAFKKHLNKYHINIINKEVLSLDYFKNQFIIKTKGCIYNFPIVVIASGTIPEETPLKYPAAVKHKIFYELKKLKNIHHKNIIIIGGGDAAFDYGLNLAKKNKVMILCRSNRFKCLPVLYERALKNKNIKLYTGIVVKNIKIEEKYLKIECTKNRNLSCDILLIAIGRKPNLVFVGERLKNTLKKLEKQHKLYIIGDAKNKIFRQTAIAIGDGIKTAMEIALLIRKKI